MDGVAIKDKDYFKEVISKIFNNDRNYIKNVLDVDDIDIDNEGFDKQAAKKASI